MSSELWCVLLYAIATGVAIIARRIDVPYSVALVFTGLVLGPTHIVRPPELSPKLLYSIFLPGLIFEAAYHLKVDEVHRTKARILALAVPGVVVGMFVTAALLSIAGGAGMGSALPFRYGLVFAAIVSATDPIAVIALFKRLRAPQGLRVLAEGESLLNDGTAIVLFSVVMAVVTGGSSSLPGATLFFLRAVSVGIAVGGALGVAAMLVAKLVDDPMIEITITTIAAYGSFAVAEHLRGSGVLATVTSGMFCGNYLARVAMSPRSREAVSAFWEYVAFALNSLVFLLVGFTVDLRLLFSHGALVVVAFLVSLVARALVVAVVSGLFHRTRERMPWAWSVVLTWAGLRGALSMVLAIALPRDFPYRDAIVAMTFGVVVLSLFVQGLSAAPLIRWLGLGTKSEHLGRPSVPASVVQVERRVDHDHT